MPQKKIGDNPLEVADDRRDIPKIFKVDPVNPDSWAIRFAANKILDGGLVAFPTETVYGLGANAFNSEAVDRIFKAKKRPFSDPIIVHVASILQLENVAKVVSELAWQLAERFWPGPLTLIVPRSQRVPPNVSSGLPTVAVRMPNHRVPLALIDESGVPIAAPSANIFSRPSATLAQHVIDDFHEEIDVILDGGPALIGVESTVLDLTQNPPIILRPGGTPLETLRTIIPELSYKQKYLSTEPLQTASPGMLMKHYSPKAQLLLFIGPIIQVRTRIQDTIVELLRKGKRVGLMIPSEDYVVFQDYKVEFALLGSESDLQQISFNLFSGMRELDNKCVDVILVRGVGRDGLGLAIWDRLLRAAEGRIIQA
jgi:L-threonylcarbamoyladenylate synthase